MTVDERVSEEIDGVQADQALAERRYKAVSFELMLGIAQPLMLALGWEGAVRAGLVTGRLMPPPSKIFSALLTLAQSGELLLHVSATLSRVLGGFAIGAIAGTVLGALTGASGLARRVRTSRGAIHRPGAAVHPLARHF